MARLSFLLWGIFISSLGFAFYCFYQISHSKMEVQQAIQSWDEAIESFDSRHSSSSLPHSLIGKVTLPAIDLELPIIQGVSPSDLQKGVGYDPITPLPGEVGNTVLAGHRDGVFRRLGELQKGDDIRIQTLTETFYYEMVSHKIVDKDDVYAVQPSQQSQLTLITCYPFSFIGDAPKRYIIEATLKAKPR